MQHLSIASELYYTSWHRVCAVCCDCLHIY